MSTPAISDSRSFYLEARSQVVCANCQTGARFHAHHVLDKQTLRKRGEPLYDTRNALRLCTRCHMQFEWAGPGKVAIPVAKLLDINICYLWEVLGVASQNYLTRRYGGLDLRYLLHPLGGCKLCQPQ
jgi:hypothetical protein